MEQKRRQFTVTIEGTARLSEWEIWPDGDGPDTPTPADVLGVMKQDGRTPVDLLRDWNLAQDFVLVIRCGDDEARWRMW
jgi:hypothetical protein